MNMDSLLRLAPKISERSTNRSFIHICFAVRGGSIVSIGFNHDKIHAEQVCLNRIWQNKRQNLTLVSLRLTRSRTKLAMAKPCDECMKLIKESKIKKVLYSTPERTIETLKIA